MNTSIFERIRDGLLEKRSYLRLWLQTTPEEVRHSRLGSNETEAVESYLETIERTIESAEAGNLGLCQVCRGHVETELVEMDYTACVCLDHLSIPERRELEHELELAQSVQRALLPHEVPTIPGLEVAAFSRPAQYVGGDYFDFIELQAGHLALAIADVAGHGMSASLHMASVQTLLRSLAPAASSPADVIRKIQALFRYNIRFNTFVTLFLGVYDLEKRSLTYASAGHNPALLVQVEGDPAVQIKSLGPTGPAVGLLEEADFQDRTIPMAQGDILLLYTDGITEARNEQDVEFGQSRLAEVLRGNIDRSPRELLKEIRARLDEFAGHQPPLDDITLVVCKVAHTLDRALETDPGHKQGHHG